MLKFPGPHDGLRVGLFGGSFNPAHDGHLHVAQTAQRALDLDWVWWLVARGNPLKSDHGDFQSRYASAKHCVNAHPSMRVSDIEQQLNLNYSVDVLTSILRHAPRARFAWIMGGDSLANFHLWRHWQSIAQMLPIIIVARPGVQQAALNSTFAQRFSGARVSVAQAKKLTIKSPPAWVYVPAPLNPLSSTSVRGN